MPGAGIDLTDCLKFNKVKGQMNEYGLNHPVKLVSISILHDDKVQNHESILCGRT